MEHDIGHLLNNWDFDPDEFLARRIQADDGSEKIQIRIDMGILQLETVGRPDGVTPFGYSSLLDYSLAQIKANKEGEFTLDEDQCEELFQEAWQFYHRYLSLFFLEDYAGVVEDTEHALGIFDLVDEFAPNDDVRWYFEQYYPHAIMMQTRARAMIALESEDYPTALRAVEEGIANIEHFVEEWESEIEEEIPEIAFLREWHEELEQERPLTQREQLERDLDEAVAAENFEEAARLRDKIQTLWPGPRRLFRPER
ncbi:MAG: UvrB/UvrC motif-containing protein [Candidatus Latescibacterota bacterium]|nr:UvrB/UvrC motif-containing protein [Candidatus Latescibacterota bacterium]MEE2627025.1 UvrB/UvrC motif-containing protein [Candidatus Latescibacterota bacterium]MEE2728610.1 UvrB/UvrC motif-containing protein [Candidatus Latescibacterota bacterium]